MLISSKGITQGIIADRFGGRGNEFNENGISTYSLPTTITEAPVHTVSFALVLEDKDASYSVTGGFSWIHWLAANIVLFEIMVARTIQSGYEKKRCLNC